MKTQKCLYFFNTRLSYLHSYITYKHSNLLGAQASRPDHLVDRLQQQSTLDATPVMSLQGLPPK